MKTLRTIAAVLVAAVMVLGPTVAFAAATVTVSTNATSYAGLNPIQVTGTVSPAPTVSNTAVVITTMGPAGAVDVGTAIVATGTGAYSYGMVPGGSTMWVTGTYTVNATYGGPSGSGSATATFTYSSSGTTQSVTTTTVTTTVTTAVSTATVTSTATVVNPDTAALNTIQTTLGGISTTLGTLSTGFSSINQAVQGLTTSINTISTGVTGLQTSLTSISTGLTTLGNIGNEITSMNNAVNNNQTYVLVVAALAAITLVLELAILVRKLS